MHSTESGKDSVGISNKAKKSLYEKIKREYEQSTLQDLECFFFRSMQIEEIIYNFTLQKYGSFFITYELPAGIRRIKDRKTTLSGFQKPNFQLTIPQKNLI